MMPERNQKLGERDERLATDDEYQRPEQTSAEQQRGTDEMRSAEMPVDEMRTDEAPSDEMRSDETQTAETQTAEMRSDETQSGEQVAGRRLPGQGGAPADDGQRARLVPEDHAASYASRWDAVKGAFVDEPREAVAQADALVGELLEELEALFREQRRDIERGLDSDEASTEDLRMALRRYRSFFDRLLAL